MRDKDNTFCAVFYRGASSRSVLYAMGVLLLLCSVILTGLIGSTTLAQTTITEGYDATEELSIATLVSLKKNSTSEVIAANTDSVNSLLGVIVNADNSLLSISSGKAQVQVATSGTVPVIVSDINGMVKRGDHITASPISGVGMRATGNVRIIGIAQGDMSAGSKQTYKDKSGTERSAKLAQIPVLVNVAYYFKQPEKTIVPSAVQNVANALAGKEVQTLPIIVSVIIFLVTIIVVVSIIFSMIRSSIISVGRNPMSQSAVYRGLIQISSLVLVILTVGMISIYLVLTKL